LVIFPTSLRSLCLPQKTRRTGRENERQGKDSKVKGQGEAHEALGDMNEFVHLDAEPPFGMLEDIIHTELYGRAIYISLSLTDEDGAKEIGLSRRKVTDIWRQVNILPYREAELIYAIREITGEQAHRLLLRATRDIV
jgi:hypothetical protein